MKSIGSGDLAARRCRRRRRSRCAAGSAGGRTPRPSPGRTGRPARGRAPRAAAARCSGKRPSSGGLRRASNSSRRQDASSSSSQRAGRSSTVTPCRPSGGTTWLPGGRKPPSTTNRRCGVAGRSSAPKRGRSLRSGGSSAARSLSEVDTIRIGPTASDCCGGQRVRQPLHPVPVGEVLLGGQHRDLEVLGRLERRRAADHRPGERARLLLGAAHLDPVERPQVDRRGQVRQQPVHDQQPVQRRGGGRVDLVDDRRLGRDQLERERLGAEAVADVQEVRVGGVVLPDAGPLLGQRRQGRRRRVLPGQGAALLVGGLAGDLADVGEVPQVLGARARHLLARAASAAGRSARR